MYHVNTYNYRLFNKLPDDPTDQRLFTDKELAFNYFRSEIAYQKITAKDFWTVEISQETEDEFLCLAIESNDK